MNGFIGMHLHTNLSWCVYIYMCEYHFNLACLFWWFSFSLPFCEYSFITLNIIQIFRGCNDLIIPCKTFEAFAFLAIMFLGFGLYELNFSENAKLKSACKMALSYFFLILRVNLRIGILRFRFFSRTSTLYFQNSFTESLH